MSATKDKSLELQEKDTPSYVLDSLSKIKSSNATINELRTAIFAPVQRIAANSLTAREFKEKGKITRRTSWGAVTLEGVILTQLHRNILDCIFKVADESTDYIKTENNTTIIKFKASHVLREYGIKNTKRTEWLEQKLSELMSAVVKIQDNKGSHYSFQILSGTGFSKEHNSFHIEFSPRYQKFFNDNITIDYKDKISDILKIDSHLIQAIVRLSLTHNTVMNMSLFDEDNENTASSGILESIGFPIESKRSRQSAIKEIAEHKDVLAEFGVFYNPKKKNNIKYKKSLNITFVPPATNPEFTGLSVKNKEAYLRILSRIGSHIKEGEEVRKIDNIFIEKGKIKLTIHNEQEDISKTIVLDYSPVDAEKAIEERIIEEEDL